MAPYGEIKSSQCKNSIPRNIEEPIKEGLILRELELLEKDCCAINESANMLLQALGSILREETPEPRGENQTQDPVVCKLQANIRDRREQIRNANYIIRNILNRLEL